MAKAMLKKRWDPDLIDEEFVDDRLARAAVEEACRRARERGRGGYEAGREFLIRNQLTPADFDVMDKPGAIVPILPHAHVWEPAEDPSKIAVRCVGCNRTISYQEMRVAGGKFARAAETKEQNKLQQRPVNVGYANAFEDLQKAMAEAFTPYVDDIVFDIPPPIWRRPALFNYKPVPTFVIGDPVLGTPAKVVECKGCGNLRHLDDPHRCDRKKR